MADVGGNEGQDAGRKEGEEPGAESYQQRKVLRVQENQTSTGKNCSRKDSKGGSTPWIPARGILAPLEPGCQRLSACWLTSASIWYGQVVLEPLRNGTVLAIIRTRIVSATNC